MNGKIVHLEIDDDKGSPMTSETTIHDQKRCGKDARLWKPLMTFIVASFLHIDVFTVNWDAIILVITECNGIIVGLNQ